jgi:hypothetical protein
MTKRQLLIGIPVIVLLANGIGYLLVNGNRSSAPPAASAPGTPSAGSVVTEGITRGTGPAGQPSAEMQAAEEKKREETALGRRAAGLAALEAGDYDKALIQFTEARALLGDKAHVAELLRVTQDLRSRPPSPARSRVGAIPSPPPTPSAPYRAAARGLWARRTVAVKDDPGPGPAGSPGEGPPPASPSGLLIVTTTPRGLLVQVDDNPVDLTPMRTRVKPGTHRIALLDGDRKVYETTVDVRDGATATLLKDLAGPAEPAAEAPRAPVPSSSTTVSTPISGQRPEAPRVAVPPPVEVAVSRPAGLVASPPPPPPTAAPPESGGLSISSPGLYGVVWINGRARGYPPLEVRNVPAGPVKVEVRVNGVEKRASTVVVRPGSTTNVKLTAAESVQ